MLKEKKTVNPKKKKNLREASVATMIALGLANIGGFLEELMRNWESLRQDLGSHCLKLAVNRHQLGSS